MVVNLPDKKYSRLLWNCSDDFNNDEDVVLARQVTMMAFNQPAFVSCFMIIGFDNIKSKYFL